MKRAICLCLALIIMIPMIPCRVQALDNRVHCRAGETFFAVFALAEDGARPDGVMARLVFDTDLFAVVPGLDLIGADGFSILNRHPAVLQFKVSRYAPPGEYSIEAQVVEAADADGKEYTNMKIAPVRIVVESAADATPENTTAPGVEQTNAESGKKQIKAGDYVTFGHYPQTAAGDDQTPIEWLVLDVQGNKALLLSRYGLDAKPYNERSVDITWERCTLRAWLNQEFLNKAFNSTEQNAILMTNVDNGRNQGYNEYSTLGGNNTQDKVFLLSYAEAYKYLAVEHFSYYQDSSGKYIYINFTSRVSPTAYAIRQGAKTNSEYPTTEDDSAGWWWLRSPGGSQSSAAIVHHGGSLNYYYVFNVDGCVRPALWVNLDPGIF